MGVNYMEEKLVYSSTNAMEIDYICSVLKENDIPFVKKTEGAGDYLNIATGNLLNYTIKISVSSEDYEKAHELIEAINNSNKDFQVNDLPDELKDISKEEEKEMDENAKKTKDFLKMFIVLFVFLPILIVVMVAIITSMLQS